MSAPSRPLLVTVLLTAAVALWLFPGPYFSQAVGLDGSYGWGINAFSATGATWGADGAFTFGPLGYLLLPLEAATADGADGGHRGRALAFWLLAHGFFVAAFARQAWRRPDRATAFAVLMVAAEVLGLGFGYRLLILALLLLAAERRDRLPWATLWASALALVLLLARFHLGVAATAVVLVHLLAERRLAAWLEAATVAIAGGATAWVACFEGSVANVVAWLHLQSELTAGFGAAMSLPRSEGAVLATGLVGLAAAALAAGHSLTGPPAPRCLWWLGALPLLIAFKHGFVRQDAHVQIFFAFLVAFAGLALLFSEGRAAAAVAAVALLVALPSAATTPSRHDVVLGLQGWNNLRALWTLDGIDQRLEQQGRRAFDKRRLPAAWQRDLRSATAVDVVPWELTWLPANDLPWRPHPTLQLYTAYTADLDARVAEHFGGESAPQRLLVHFDSLGQRHLLWDTPATWRRLLRRYRPLRRDDGRRLVLLARRPETAADEAEVARQVLEEDQWQTAPTTAGAASPPLLFAEIDLRPNLRGRLAGSLWRTPPVYLEIDLGGERIHRHRLLPATAGGGLLVPPPTTFGAFQAVLQGSPVGRARRVRLTGPGLSHYRQPVDVRWVASR